jgi:hypothetical protein
MQPESLAVTVLADIQVFCARMFRSLQVDPAAGIIGDRQAARMNRGFGVTGPGIIVIAQLRLHSCTASFSSFRAHLEHRPGLSGFREP